MKGKILIFMLLILIFMLLFVTSCAEYTWVAPPGKTSLETQIDYNDCLQYVDKNYPQIPEKPPKITGYSCYGSWSSLGSWGSYTTHCTPQYDYVSQSFNALTRIAREEQRKKAFEECIQSKGYQKVKK